jgi:Tol biopolymer transport system component
MAVSADGQRFAVVTDQGLYVRERNTLEARRLYEYQGILSWSMFSPDGKSIAFYEEGQLKRAEVSGGTPAVIASLASVPFGASWIDDDTVLIGQPQGIVRVAADGGTPEVVIPSRAGEVYVRRFPDADRWWPIYVAGGFDPVWSPDGRALFHRAGQAIMEVSVKGDDPAEWGRPVQLFDGDTICSARALGLSMLHRTAGS